MKRSILPSALLILAATALTGCLHRDVDHRLYLEPDGALTWTVFERDVRALEGDPAERTAAEETFRQAAAAGDGEVAQALTRLGGEQLETWLLHDRRPYIAVSQAYFPDVAALVEAYGAALGVRVEATLTSRSNRRTLQVTLYATDGEVADEAALALLADSEKHRIVLTQGTFVDAQGFRLEERKSAAVPLALSDEEEKALERGETVTRSLTWRVG